jgi:peptidoglycan-associated lipoprotein
MRSLQILTFVTSTSILLAACSSTPKEPEKPVTTPMAAATHQSDSRTIKPLSITTDPLDDPKGTLAQRSVYFDFDKYDVKPEYNQLVTAHSKYLESHKMRKIVVQGNTDERGSAEYNLALGEKRSEAVLKDLKAMGVSDTQMEAVSFGKEKPKALGHDEAAWAQDRRADIVYAGSGK